MMAQTEWTLLINHVKKLPVGEDGFISVNSSDIWFWTLLNINQDAGLKNEFWNQAANDGLFLLKSPDCQVVSVFQDGELKSGFVKKSPIAFYFEPVEKLII